MEFTLGDCRSARLMTPVRPVEARQVFFVHHQMDNAAVLRRSIIISLLAMVWFVAVGSALGGVTRFLLGALLQQRAGTSFPAGTLIINITGSFLLGLLLRYSLGTTAISPEVRGLLTTGFCGGYTTFSTFTYDTLVLVEDGETARAALYVGASVVVALVGAYLGIVLARELLALRDGA